jgi:CHAT domain-containing protein/tetratricopeptide (TPR) repeat protein
VIPLLLLVAILIVPVPSAAATYEDVVALQNRALAARSLGEALRDHAQSLEIAERLGRPRLVAVLFQRLGHALERANRVQEAVIAYESGVKALAADRGTDVRAAIESLATIRKTFIAGASPVAADLYSAPLARDLAAAEADPVLPAALLVDVGNAYLRQPQPEPALNAYRQALGRPELAAAPRLRGYALANAGEILRRQGAVDDAERALTEALDLLRRHAPPPERRRALALLAGIHRDRRRAGEALAEYAEALALYRQAGDARGEGRAQAGLGRLHLEARRFADALAAYRAAVDLGEPAHDVESLWHAYWGLGQSQRATGDLAGAVASFETSLDLIERRQRDLRTDEGKVALLDSVQDVFDELIGVLLDRAAVDPSFHRAALAAAERARAGALHELMGGAGRRGLACPATPAPGTAGPSDAERAAGADPSRREPHPAAQMALGVPSGRGATQSAAGTRSGEGDRGVPPPPDPRCAAGRRVEPVTPPALARLVFHVLADRTAVFAVDRAGAVRGHVAPLGRRALGEMVAGLRDALGVDAAGRGVRPVDETGRAASPPAADGGNADYGPRLARLHAALVAPVAGALPAGEPVVVEPHGPLWLLPFAALRAADGTYLADRWPILHAPSFRVLDEIRREPAYVAPADLRALVVGNPTPPGLGRGDDERFRGRRVRATFQPLPGAEREARTIAALLPEGQRTVLVGDRADLAAVEAAAREHTVLHLASHALAFPGSPLESFVMLASAGGGDGRLTARRVLDLSLAADLVTLSACQTGMGHLSGDGVIGLSRAFLVRGARSVVVSLWSVSDTATAELMTVFYRAYLGGAEDKARALQRAMRAVRARPGTEHPRYWAPFVLIGSER